MEYMPIWVLPALKLPRAGLSRRITKQQSDVHPAKTRISLGIRLHSARNR